MLTTRLRPRKEGDTEHKAALPASGPCQVALSLSVPRGVHTHGVPGGRGWTRAPPGLRGTVVPLATGSERRREPAVPVYVGLGHGACTGHRPGGEPPAPGVTSHMAEEGGPNTE